VLNTAYRNSHCYGLKPRLQWTKLSKGRQQSSRKLKLWLCYVYRTETCDPKTADSERQCDCLHAYTVYFTHRLWQMAEWSIYVVMFETKRYSTDRTQAWRNRSVNKDCFQLQTELLLSSSRPVTVYRCANSFVKCAATFWIEAESYRMAQKSVNRQQSVRSVANTKLRQSICDCITARELCIQHGGCHVEQFL
jgi:hypothetical protein